MFDLCQKVYIYNIENHYHVYSDRKAPETLHGSLRLSRLKAAPIKVTKRQTTHVKTLPNGKKGIKLSTRMTTQQTCNFQNLSQIVLPSPRNIPELMLVRGQNPKAEEKQKKPLETDRTEEPRTNPISMRASSHLKIDMQKAHRVDHCQKILAKQKPKIMPNSNIPSLKNSQCPLPLLKNLSSTMEATFVSRNKNFNIQSQERLRQKLDIKEVGTSHHFELDNENEDNPIRKCMQEIENQPHSLMRSISSSTPHYRRNSLEVISDQFNEASIMLSQILSRESHSQMLNEENFHRSGASNRQRIRNLFQEHDRMTIVSNQNDIGENGSIKIQQSMICDHQGLNNFKELELGKLETNQYTLKLGIQVEMNCFVSLKKINMSMMNLIAEELRIYHILEESATDQASMASEAMKNILELYQVQMSESSYLLIKEPYTISFYEKFINSSATEKDHLRVQLRTMILKLLEELSSNEIHPVRMLGVEDFVVSCSVIKLQDLSLLKQMKEPIFQFEELLQHIDSSLQFLVYH